ncbi:hypothetical protein C8R43DRAFT_1109255 [Mycena crocata]|nr:hypothetical protein C8R43DRAFT_1109255 [Mycena crocata]
MDVDTTSNEPQRVQELWFQDGNLVIQAGKSLFRVYRGILATHSPVFEDMLSFPQPPDSELVDGCPLVRLPDASNEVAVFLKALLNPQFFLPFPAPTQYDTIAGCLRLSHKYGVDFLRRRALVHFSSAYTTLLSEWDVLPVDSAAPPLPPLTSWQNPSNPAFNLHFIQLSREVDALWLLPLGFYRLSAALSYSALGRDIFHGAIYNDIPASLSIQDQDTFLKRHIIQCSSTTADIMRFLSHPVEIEGCTSSTLCLVKRLRAVESSREMLRANPSIPLDVWDSGDWETLTDLCPICFRVLEKAHKHARVEFWDTLPEMYDLPPWEELEKMKTAAIGTSMFH